MISAETVLTALQDHGLWIVALASIIEGPIVTVLSAALAREGVFALVPLLAILLLGDLVGDLLHFLVGCVGLRRVPPRWRRRMGLGAARVQALVQHFHVAGGRTLVIGKLTHSAGAAVLVAAGIARMPIMPFLGWNLLASLPKTAAFAVLGWYAGDTWRQVDQWLGRGAAVVAVAIVLLGAVMLYRRRICPKT